MSDWNFLNQQRITSGPFATSSEDGFTGRFVFGIPGDGRRVICTTFAKEGWKCVVIISEVPCLDCANLTSKVASLFFDQDQCVLQFVSMRHQPEDGRIRLWAPPQGTFPEPPI